jgi:hypothetical protein
MKRALAVALLAVAFAQDAHPATIDYHKIFYAANVTDKDAAIFGGAQVQTWITNPPTTANPITFFENGKKQTFLHAKQNNGREIIEKKYGLPVTDTKKTVSDGWKPEKLSYTDDKGNTATATIVVDKRIAGPGPEVQIRVGEKKTANIFLKDSVKVDLQGTALATVPTHDIELHSADSFSAVKIDKAVLYRVEPPEDPKAPIPPVPTIVAAQQMAGGRSQRHDTGGVPSDGTVIDPLVLTLFDITDPLNPVTIGNEVLIEQQISLRGGFFEMDNTGILLGIDAAQPDSEAALMFSMPSEWVQNRYGYSAVLNAAGLTASGELEGWTTSMHDNLLTAFYAFGASGQPFDYVEARPPASLFQEGHSYSYSLGSGDGASVLQPAPEPATFMLTGGAVCFGIALALSRARRRRRLGGVSGLLLMWAALAPPSFAEKVDYHKIFYATEIKNAKAEIFGGAQIQTWIKEDLKIGDTVTYFENSRGLYSHASTKVPPSPKIMEDKFGLPVVKTGKTVSEGWTPKKLEFKDRYGNQGTAEISVGKLVPGAGPEVTIRVGKETFPNVFLKDSVKTDIQGTAFASEPNDERKLHSADSFAAVQIAGANIFKVADPKAPGIPEVAAVSGAVMAGGNSHDARPGASGRGWLQDPIVLSVLDMTDLENPRLLASETLMTLDAHFEGAAFLNMTEKGIYFEINETDPLAAVELAFLADSAWVAEPYAYGARLDATGFHSYGALESGWDVGSGGGFRSAFFQFSPDGMPLDFVRAQPPASLFETGRTYAYTLGSGNGAYAIETVPEPGTLLTVAGALVLWLVFRRWSPNLQRHSQRHSQTADCQKGSERQFIRLGVLARSEDINKSDHRTEHRSGDERQENLPDTQECPHHCHHLYIAQAQPFPMSHTLINRAQQPHGATAQRRGKAGFGQ